MWIFERNGDKISNHLSEDEITSLFIYELNIKYESNN